MPAGGEDQARAFYAGLLGIPERAKPANLAKRGGCWFEAGALKVHLGVDADFRAALKAHPAFLVDDVGFLAKKLRPQAAGLLKMSRWKDMSGSMSMIRSATASN